MPATHFCFKIACLAITDENINEYQKIDHLISSYFKMTLKADTFPFMLQLVWVEFLVTQNHIITKWQNGESAFFRLVCDQVERNRLHQRKKKCKRNMRVKYGDELVYAWCLLLETEQATQRHWPRLLGHMRVLGDRWLH